jgi:hypothetical protein
MQIVYLKILTGKRSIHLKKSQNCAITIIRDQKCDVQECEVVCSIGLKKIIPKFHAKVSSLDFRIFEN